MNEQASKTTVIIIPAHNEEGNLQSLLDRIAEYHVAGYADILIVDDGSTDATAEIARRNALRLLRFPHNLGYGNALRAGYQYAIRNGYQYVIQMDADGQHDPGNIPKLCEALAKTEGEPPDIVLGSRFMPDSGPYETGFFRRAGIAWQRLLIRLLTGEHIADPTTGLQGLRHSAFRYYACSEHYDPNYPDANVLIQMLMTGYRIAQIPAVMHTRETGSGMHDGLFRPAAYMIRSTMSILSYWLCVQMEGWRGNKAALPAAADCENG